MEKMYEIGEIPFYYTILPNPSNPADLPDKLSIKLSQDKFGVIRQIPSVDEQELLNLAYEKGSQISGLMDDTGIGKKYADDFIKFIIRNEQCTIEGKKILEVGCGTGYLLYQFYKMGAEVLGVEPGEYGIEGMKKYGIPILHDFFDSKKIMEQYDIVIFYGVLEHMQDTEGFLQGVKSVLKEDGKIFLSVPNCEPYIESGDISMLMHEHWNYFTKDTLENLVVSNGLCGEIKKSEFAGTLYASLKKVDYVSCKDRKYSLLINYIEKVNVQKRKVYEFIETVLCKHTLGIYVPGRMINMLSLCYDKIPNGIRFFDDNSNFYGMFFPGIDIQIENYEDLRNDPTEVILIASHTFGSKIKERIAEGNIKSKVVLLEELFG